MLQAAASIVGEVLAEKALASLLPLDKMFRVPFLESSSLHSAGYYDGVLTIVFRNMKDCSWRGVEAEVFLELISVKSPGSYFNDNIRGQYPRV